MEPAESSPGGCSGGPAPLTSAPGPRHSFHYGPPGDETGDTRTDLIAARLVRRVPSGRKPASAPLGGGPAQEEAEPASLGRGGAGPAARWPGSPLDAAPSKRNRLSVKIQTLILDSSLSFQLNRGQHRRGVRPTVGERSAHQTPV